MAGGFEEETEVRSSIQSADVTPLMVTHEETDTRLVLHAVNCSKDDIVVSARDTDVLLSLVDHFPRVLCRNLWMMAGTSKKRRYIPIHPV